MTIQFNCPNCDELIAFDSKHIGRRARCISCGQILIIPAKDYEKAQKIEVEVKQAEPLGGFYRAVFADSWKLFVDRENVTSLVFVAAAVCFKFFLARGICCVNYLTSTVVWGLLFGFYLNIIYEAAFGVDKLPEIHLGTGVILFWHIVKPFFTFFITLFVVWLPFIVTLALLENKGIGYENMWRLEFGPRLLLQIFFIVGLFFFPMAILTTSVGRDITLLRPDYLFRPIRSAFGSYLVTFCLLVVFGVLESQSGQYAGATLPVTMAYLGMNLVGQVIAIMAMRSIGLFYRHYNCYIGW